MGKLFDDEDFSSYLWITECLTPCEVQTNLMGDAAERLGKKIAQFIKKQIE